MTGISDILAAAAITSGLFAYRSTSDRQLKTILFFQALLLAAHYYLEGSYTASFVTLCIAPLNLLSVAQAVRAIYPFFATLVLAVGVASFSGMRDIFPIAAVSLSLYALFNLEGVVMRSALVTCSLLWVVHDVVYDLPIILVMDITLFIINLTSVIGMIRDLEREGSVDRAVDRLGIQGVRIPGKPG